ncbi:hypothetical protein GEMRC1_011320 [Eukaryota sp. GEM-RC1]
MADSLSTIKTWRFGASLFWFILLFFFSSVCLYVFRQLRVPYLLFLFFCPILYSICGFTFSRCISFKPQYHDKSTWAKHLNLNHLVFFSTNLVSIFSFKCYTNPTLPTSFRFYSRHSYFQLLRCSMALYSSPSLSLLFPSWSDSDPPFFPSLKLSLSLSSSSFVLFLLSIALSGDQKHLQDVLYYAVGIFGKTFYITFTISLLRHIIATFFSQPLNLSAIFDSNPTQEAVACLYSSSPLLSGLSEEFKEWVELLAIDYLTKFSNFNVEKGNVLMEEDNWKLIFDNFSQEMKSQLEQLSELSQSHSLRKFKSLFIFNNPFKLILLFKLFRSVFCPFLRCQQSLSHQLTRNLGEIMQLISHLLVFTDKIANNVQTLPVICRSVVDEASLTVSSLAVFSDSNCVGAVSMTSLDRNVESVLKKLEYDASF